MLDMHRVAQRIYKAIVRREKEVYIQWYWRYAMGIANLFHPWLRDRLILFLSKMDVKFSTEYDEEFRRTEINQRYIYEVEAGLIILS